MRPVAAITVDGHTASERYVLPTANGATNVSDYRSYWPVAAQTTDPNPNMVHRPRGRREDMPPADGSSMVAYRFVANPAITDPKIAADLRPSADASAVRTPLVAGGG